MWLAAARLHVRKDNICFDVAKIQAAVQLPVCWVLPEHCWLWQRSRAQRWLQVLQQSRLGACCRPVRDIQPWQPACCCGKTNKPVTALPA